MEYTQLQAVDFTLGRLLVDIFAKQQQDHGPAMWQTFLKRDVKTKILRSDFETVADIVKAMESAEKHAAQDGMQRSNSVQLPLICYGRKPNLMMADPDAAAYIFDKVVVDDDGRDLRLSVAQLNMEYRIAMLAWDRPTLDMMQLAWLFHVGKPEQHRLSYDVMIGESKLEITGELIDPKTPMFEDASLDRGEGRLHAIILPVQVKIYAVMGDGYPVIPESFQWMLKSPMDGWFGPGSFWGVGGHPYEPDNIANDTSLPGGGNTGGVCDGDACWPNIK